MEKYYDLIASLVKSHRKFPGCEAILDDIVQDVYNHAEVVLSTVTNESVVTSYLNKIVSTSMITVPKRLGVTAEKRENTPSYTDIILSSKEAVSDNKEPELELTEDATESEELVYEDNTSQDEEDFAELNIEEDQEDDLILEDTAAEENILKDEDEQNNEPDVNMELVDKMINGVPVADEVVEDMVLETEETNEAEEFVFDDTPKSTDIIEEDSLENTFEVEDNSDELIMESSIDEQPVELAADEDESENELVLDNNEEELVEENSETDTLIEEPEELLESEEQVESCITEEDVQSDVDSSLYGRFKYTPEKPEINCDEILSEINTLDSKNPDKHIKEICKLKYEEMLSVSEIANKLGIEENNVIEALNEIIYTIKE